MTATFSARQNELIQLGLSMLHQADYFPTLAFAELENLANSFDSTPIESQVALVNRSTSRRQVLQWLAQESATAAKDMEDSNSQENQNEIDVA